MFSQYISTSKKKKHMFPCSNIHLLIVPPKLRHYPTFRCFHFWHSSKTKKKHAPPWFHPGNPCENVDPNAKPPRPKTTQPDGFTAQATYAADLIGGETAQDLQVRWRSVEKKLTLLRTHHAAFFKKKHDHLANWVDVSMWMALFSMA